MIDLESNTCPFCNSTLEKRLSIGKPINWYVTCCNNANCKYKYELERDFRDHNQDSYVSVFYAIDKIDFVYYFINGYPKSMRINFIDKPAIVLNAHVPVTPDNYQEAMDRINKLQVFQ